MDSPCRVLLKGYTNQYRFRKSVVDPRVEICQSVDGLGVSKAALRTKHELDLTQSRSGRRQINLHAMFTDFKHGSDEHTLFVFYIRSVHISSDFSFVRLMQTRTIS